MTYKKDDVIKTWFNPAAKIISVSPYKGRYSLYFKNVLKVTAPKTERGWMEILEIQDT